MTDSHADGASALVTLDSPMVDERGYIQPLIDQPVASALLITGKRGTVRGNHRHRTDWHYSYVVSGRLEYFWRGDEDEDTQSVVVDAGQMVFSPPGVDHAFRFLEETVFLALARNPRDQASYEADTIRTQLVSE